MSAFQVLPFLFNRGNAGRASGFGMYGDALNRDQRGRQFRRQVSENRRAQDKQIQAQKDAQKRAFGYQLAGQGINAAAGAGAGAILAEATGPAVSTLADTAGKTIAPDVAGSIATTAAPQAGPSFTPPIGGNSAALNLPPVDYSPMSTNIPAANANPGLTGLENFDTARTTAFNVMPGTENAGPLPNTGGPVVDPTADARIPEWSRGAPLKSGRLSPGQAAALGALSGFTGQDYLGTGLNFANRNPVTNAKFGLDLAATGSGIGLDAARAAQAYSGAGANDALANDRNASASRTRFLTPYDANERLTAGDANAARAGYYDAGTEGRNLDNTLKTETSPFSIRKAQADATYAEGRANTRSTFSEPDLVQNYATFEDGLKELVAVNAPSSEINASIDAWLAQNANRIEPGRLEEIKLRLQQQFGYRAPLRPQDRMRSSSGGLGDYPMRFPQVGR